MLESLVNPAKTDKHPIKMLFIGIIYASLSFILTRVFFSSDPVLVKYSGMIVVIFCVMFSLPFMYFIIKKEEDEDEETFGLVNVWKIHKDAILALMWLFVGFVIAFGFWHLVIQDPTTLNAQIETYCVINAPQHVQECVQKYTGGNMLHPTGAYSSGNRLLAIIENNIYVMIFTLIFSLIFGAGAIFILAWNATVIAGAIGIFSKYTLSNLPLGLARYMIHGFPEIGAYFITALAGGILGVGFLRHGINDPRFFKVLENVAVLLFFALLILLLAGVMEVYFTPIFFS
jgi:uncharacterized membrane protein SpoIIM required for sporulation